MQIFDILVLISIISIGLIPYLLVKKFSNFHIELFDSFLVIIVFSFSIICFPLIFFGTLGYSHLFKLYINFLTVISLSFVLYFIFRNFHNLIKLVNYYNLDNSPFIKIITIIFSIAVITYFFHAILLPLRGFDALTLYFPDAILFSQLNTIPIFNPLNFYPVIKEPLNSLIYAYSIDLVNSISVDLVILLVIFLWALVTYQLTLLLFPENKNLAFLSALMFLFFPLNLWFLDQWFYYQDIFLGFFFTVTIYFFLKSFDTSNSKSISFFYIIVSSLSFGLSLISKSSGWILIVILVALYLYYSPYQKLNKIFYLLFFGILILVGMINLYIVIVPFFIILLFLSLYHSSNTHLYSDQLLSKRSSLLIILPIGILLGGYWFYYTFTKFSVFIGSTKTNLFNFHLYLSSSPTNVAFNSINYTFESAHRTNFYSLIFVLLVGNLFAAFWALPKVLALIKRSAVSVLILWTIIFFSIWLVFNSISIRYLTPIISPLIIITLYGFLIIKSKLEFLYVSKFSRLSNVKEEFIESFSPFWYAIIISLGLLSLYFPIPLNLLSGLDRYAITRAYMQSTFLYYSNWFLVLLILVVVPLLLYFLLLKFNFYSSIFSLVSKLSGCRFKKTIFISLLVFILVFPNFVLFDVFSSTNYSVPKTQQLYIYESRPQVQQLLNIITAENRPTAGIMIYDTPGIPVWTGNPTFDFFYGQNVLSPLFSNINITECLQILLNPYSYLASLGNYSLPTNFVTPSIDYVVIPNTGNLYYSNFMHDYRDKYYLFGVLQNPQYFSLLFNNSDFRLYERIYSNPAYSGVLDLGLQFGNQSIPTLGPIPDYQHLNSTINAYAKFNFPVHPINANVSIQTTVLLGNQLSILNTSLSLGNVMNDQFSTIWDLPLNSSFSLTNISINLEYLTPQLKLTSSTWNFNDTSPISVIKNSNQNGFILQSSDGLSYAN